MELLKKFDLPVEFHNFYSRKEIKHFPTNISNLQFFIPEKNVDLKSSLFKEYLEQENKKIIDEIHFSYEGLGFVENLQHCGYSVIIFQKRHIKDESELFLSRVV
jgi:hypothetical protein